MTHGYRAVIPRHDDSRAGRLRNRVVAAGRWRSRWLGEWRPAKGAGLALAAVILLGASWVTLSAVSKSGAGSIPGSATTAGAATVLKHALKASSNPAPYSGTSEITFALAPSQAPPAASGDLGQNRIVSQYALQDSTHWWIHTHILQPALQREDQFAVADGKTAVWYRSLTNTALSFPLQSGTVSGLFGELQGSHSIAENLNQFVRALSHIPGERAVVIRQDRLRLPGDSTATHLTDVLQVSPVIRESGSCSGAAHCASKSHGYGRALFWIERSDGLVLRYQEMGMPTSGEFPQHFVYQVTSLKRSGPTAAQLAYRSPVTPIPSSSSVSSSSGGVSVGGSLGSQWTAPTGLVSLPAPTDAHGYAYTSCGSGQGTDSQGNTISASVLFVNGWKSGPLKGRICTHPFVYLQEQVRTQGLPAPLQVGSGHVTGGCTAYASSYHDGLHWLALQKGKASILAVADKLDRRALISYADRACR